MSVYGIYRDVRRSTHSANATRRNTDHDNGCRVRFSARTRLRRDARQAAAARRLSHRRRAARARDARARRRRESRAAVGRDRRDSADVRRRAPLLARRSALRSAHRDSRSARAHRAHDAAVRGHRSLVGMEHRCGAGVRTRAGGGEHGRGAAHARRPRTSRHDDGHDRSRLARRRGSRVGVRARAASTARRPTRRNAGGGRCGTD